MNKIYTVVKTKTDYTTINDRSIHTDNCEWLGELTYFIKNSETITLDGKKYKVLDYQEYEKGDDCPYYYNNGVDFDDYLKDMEIEKEVFILVE